MMKYIKFSIVLLSILLTLLPVIVFATPDIKSGDIYSGRSYSISSTFYSSSSDGYLLSYSSPYDNTENTADIVNTTDKIAIGQKLFASEYSIFRGYLYFDTSALTSDVTVTGATLSLYGQSDYSITDFDLTVEQDMPTYPHDPLELYDFDKTLYDTTGSGGSLTTAGFSTSGYNNITLNATGISWINRTGYTKFCIRSSRDISATQPTGYEYVWIHSYNDGINYAPKLTLTYTVSAPEITAKNASNVSSTSARLNALLDSDGGDTTSCEVRFGYGTVSHTAGDFALYTTVSSYSGSYLTNSLPYLDVSSLSQNTTYYYRVQAKNDEGTAVTSTDEITFTTYGPVSAPTNLSATATSDSIILNWVKGSGSDSTSIYVSNYPFVYPNPNLLNNASFETNDPPDDWTLSGAGATFSRSNTQLVVGSYSGKLVRGGADCYVYQDFTNTLNSQTITIKGWVWSSVASRAYLYIDDGTTTTSSTASFTGFSSWVPKVVTQTINASATHCYVGIKVITGDTTAYFDWLSLIKGSYITGSTYLTDTSENSYTHTGLTSGKTYYYLLIGNSDVAQSDTYNSIIMTTLPNSLNPTGFGTPGNINNYNISNPDVSVLNNLGPFYTLTNNFVDSWGMARGNAWAGIIAFIIVVLGLIVYVKSKSIQGALGVVLVCLIISYYLKITSGWWILFSFLGFLGSMALPKREV